MCLFSASSNITATLFQYDGVDFKRIVSTVPKNDGSGAFAMCTNLRTSGSAYKALVKGETYEGTVTINGIVYQAKYGPMYDSATKAMIGAFYIGTPTN